MLQAGDTLVLNDTRVLPARLVGAKTDTGARAELLLLKQLTGDRWETLAKPGKRLKVGAEISFGDNGKGEPLLTATVVAEGEMGVREVEFQYIGIFQELLTGWVICLCRRTLRNGSMTVNAIRRSMPGMRVLQPLRQQGFISPKISWSN